MKPSLKAFSLIVLFLILFSSGPVRAQTSLTFVQSQSNDYNGSINSPDTDGWPGNVTNGDLLVHIFVYAAGAGTVTYSDAQGNTYNRCAIGGPFADSNGIHIDLVWTKATATGTNGITNTFTNYSGYWGYVNLEYSGQNASPCDTGTGQGNAAATSWPSGNFTMNFANEAIIGGCTASTGTQTPTSFTGTPSGTQTTREHTNGYAYGENAVTTKGTGSLTVGGGGTSVVSVCIAAGFKAATQPSASGSQVGAFSVGP